MTRGYYGSYAHDVGEIYVRSAQKVANQTPRGFIESYTAMLELGGFKKGTPAQVSAAIADMQLAYSVNGHDFVLYDDNGAATCIALRSVGSRGGTVVQLQLGLEQVDRAQLCTRLDYSLSIFAVYPALENLPGADIVQYQEQIAFAGGWPMRAVRPCVNTDAIEQVTSPRAPFTAAQSGILVSRLPNPQPNAILWPDKIIGDPQITRFSVDSYRGALVSQAVQWSYQYASSTQIVGMPLNR